MWTTLLGTTLHSSDGIVDTMRYLDDADYVMVYVSAHWCGPCRALTPVLASAYQRQTGRVRVVFVSLDRNQAQYDEYCRTMPWCAVHYDEDRQDIVRELSDMTHTPITSIPSLLVFDKHGQLVTSDGRGRFAEYFQPIDPPCEVGHAG